MAIGGFEGTVLDEPPADYIPENTIKPVLSVDSETAEVTINFTRRLRSTKREMRKKRKAAIRKQRRADRKAARRSRKLEDVALYDFEDPEEGAVVYQVYDAIDIRLSRTDSDDEPVQVDYDFIEFDG